MSRPLLATGHVDGRYSRSRDGDDHKLIEKRNCRAAENEKPWRGG
jgi:hypothetical protein